MLYPQSQLLLRNISDLTGKVLLVEPMADELAGELQRSGVDASVWCTDAAVAKAFSSLPCHFGARLAGDPQQSFAASFNSKTFDTVVLFYPKSKEQLAYSLAEISALIDDNTQLYLTGDNKGGIKSLAAHAAKLGLHAHKLDNAKHCLWFALSGLAAKPLPLQPFAQFSAKVQLSAGQSAFTLPFCSLPGVFNHGKLDSGTALLLQQLSHIQSGRVLDFACGAGIIGAALKRQHPALELWATDICALAVASTQATLALNQLSGTVLCQDGLAAGLPKFNHIVSNPPFHTGLKTDLSIAEQFISQCRQQLLSGGTLTLVANSHLPYAQWLQAQFGNVRELARQQGFVVYSCRLTA